MTMELWGPGDGQGLRGAVVLWSVKVGPRTWLSGDQRVVLRGGEAAPWNGGWARGLGEGRPQAQQD